MTEQYFETRPASRRRPARIAATIRGHAFEFDTDAGVFARGRIDRGSELLLEALEVGPRELILDLGCGYGVLGIVASRLSADGHVVLTDVNERAAGLARRNVEANRARNAEVRVGSLYDPVDGMKFDHIASNPPIRAGREVVDAIVRGAPEHLLEGGHLWLVARTKQGADSIRARIADVFGNAEIVRRGSGYKVLRARKGTS